MGPCPEGHRGRERPGRPRRRDPAPQARRPVRPDRGAGRRRCGRRARPRCSDRGIVLVSVAVAIALGATSMSDIALLAQLAPLLGPAPSGPRSAAPWTWPATPACWTGSRSARAKSPRARLGADRGGRGRVPVAGDRGQGPDRLAGHRHGRHPGHRPLRQGGGGSHLEERATASTRWGPGARTPASAWPCCCRPGNAGSNTFTDHKEVLAAALKQVPARFRRRVMVRIDGAGASHDLIKHLLRCPRRGRPCCSPAAG